MILIEIKMLNLNPLDHTNIQKMIIWHRKRSKISQQLLANLAGISRTAVQRLETGNAPVQLDTLFKVLNILNISLSFKSPIMEQFTNENNKDENQSEK